MSTATSSDPTVPLLGGHRHFLLRRLHSLTGIIFGGYLVVHLIVNATIAQAGDIYGVQVRKIHELPLVTAIEWLFIFLPIIFHSVYGIWITVTGKPNVTNYPYGKNWFYLLQRISAIILVLFIAYHVLSLKYSLFGQAMSFDAHRAIFSINRHMEAYPILTWIVYPLGIFAACFHMANGFWTAAITWGLTVSASAQKRWGIMCLGIFALTFALGMVALVAAVTVDPASRVAPVVLTN